MQVICVTICQVAHGALLHEQRIQTIAHMKARIWNHRSWVAEVGHRELRALFDAMLRQAGFGLVGFSDAHFQPHGYTAVWILAESHFALHTFPEEGRTYCELSSCNLEKFVALIELIEPHEIA